MISIQLNCSEEDKEKIRKAREKKLQSKDIDYEAKEYHGAYADDDTDEPTKKEGGHQ